MASILPPAVMVEDMAVNLVPAHAMGMTTVWVRTEHDWTGPKPGETHVDREIDDLADWLTSIVAARGLEGQPPHRSSAAAPQVDMAPDATQGAPLQATSRQDDRP